MAQPKEDFSEMFRHFHKLLVLVRNLLLTLNADELGRLEQKLVSGSGDEQPPSTVRALEQQIGLRDFQNIFYLFFRIHCRPGHGVPREEWN